MRIVLQMLADTWIYVVVGVALANLVMFLLLRRWSRRGPRRIVSYLEDMLGDYRRSNNDADRSVQEQIDCFVHDIREVLSDAAPPAARRELSTRLMTKDEARGYLRRDGSEWLFSVSRTLVEVHPLNGILGTVLAIAASMAASAGAPMQATASDIIRNFGNASLTTLAGLLAGVIFMIWNASMEPAVQRHFEHLHEVREVIQTARNVLMRDGAEGRP